MQLPLEGATGGRVAEVYAGMTFDIGRPLGCSVSAQIHRGGNDQYVRFQEHQADNGRRTSRTESDGDVDAVLDQVADIVLPQELQLQIWITVDQLGKLGARTRREKNASKLTRR